MRRARDLRKSRKGGNPIALVVHLRNLGQAGSGVNRFSYDIASWVDCGWRQQRVIQNARSEGKLLPNPMISHGPRMRCFELIELQVKQSAILTVPPKSTHLSNAPWMPQLIRAEKCKTSYVVRVS